MAGRRQPTNPVDSALVRLADLAGRGVMPSRMAREVEAIVAGWLSEASPVEPDEVAERLAAMHEQLVAGAGAAGEQLGDIDADDAAALRHAKLVHAALVAAVEAVERAREAQQGQAPEPVAVVSAPALAAALAVAEPPAMQPAGKEARLAADAAPGDAVTIHPLAGRNPQGVDHAYPAEVRRRVEPEQVSGSMKPSKARAAGRPRRNSPHDQEKNLPTLLR